MVISSLCLISVEGVIRGLRWGIGPEGGKALSSHHIWTFIPPARPFVGQNRGQGGGQGYVQMYGRTEGRTDGRTDGRTNIWTEWTSICDEMRVLRPPRGRCPKSERVGCCLCHSCQEKIIIKNWWSIQRLHIFFIPLYYTAQKESITYDVPITFEKMIHQHKNFNFYAFWFDTSNFLYTHIHGRKINLKLGSQKRWCFVLS
jgi:hypothetical protein